DRGVPVAALTDRQFDLVERGCRIRGREQREGRKRTGKLVFFHLVLPSRFLSYFTVSRMRSSGASLPPPRLLQFVVFGTTPSNELMVECLMYGPVVPMAGLPSRTARAASTIKRRKATTATSLAPTRSRERSVIGPIDSHMAMSWLGMPLMP